MGFFLKTVSFSLLITVLTLGNSLKAQHSVAIMEDFDSPHTNHFTQGDEDLYYSVIEDGYYKVTHKRNERGYLWYFSDRVLPHKDFTIESKMIQKSGPENQAFGLVFATKDGSSYHYFTITSTGYYEVGRYNDEKYTNKVDWTKTSLINPQGKANTLSIEKKGSKITFKINGEYMTSHEEKQFFGFNVGIYIVKNSTVWFDYFAVKYETDKLLLADQNFLSEKENLGKNVNTIYEELVPRISPDGNTLFFSRNRHPDNYGEEKKDDIWFTQLTRNNTWSKAKNIGSPLNNDGYNFVSSVLPDNNTLLLGNVYQKDGLMKGGVSISHKTKKGWGFPEKLNIKNYYNDNKYSSFCLDPTGKHLIIAAERDDSVGDKDLYVSHLLENNEWSEPENLGSIINTILGDFTPFMAPDGKTLYYASEGKPGYGSADIYVTKRLDDTWTSWSEPRNIGPQINTPNWDAYFSTPASGEYAYFTSSESSIGKEDIFRVKFRETEEQNIAEKPKKEKKGKAKKESSILPDPVVLIYGKVIDAKTLKPLGAKINYEDLDTHKNLGVARSNPSTGEYVITLPYGLHYGIHAEADQHLSLNENIDINEAKGYIEKKLDLKLTPIKVGSKIKINNLFFEKGKPAILPKSYPELNRLGKLLKENQNIQIQLAGHTDNVGHPLSLIRLSEERVKAVKEYLINNGIKEYRMTGKGYGSKQPVAPNDTEENKQKNRRVEIVITKV